MSSLSIRIFTLFCLFLTSGASGAPEAVKVGEFCVFWYGGPRSIGGIRIVDRAVVEVLQRESDWAKVRLYSSELIGSAAAVLAEVKSDSERSRQLLEKIGKTRDEFLKSANELPISPSDSITIWINLNSVDAISDEFDPVVPRSKN